ncbi:MAG: hypothetical protein J6Q61_00055 [Bacteroidales bacterium]|nr:hypothetical protein [Bacteroidales bacterium]
MAGNFQGWLIKFGEVQLPNSFLLADGWESTPNQRIELDAYRDANVLLHRETASSFKTKLKLNIREMTLVERMAFDNVIGLATLSITDKKQRRVSVTYWNDETLDYTKGIFYMSDTTYVIHHANEENKDIEYNPFTLTLIEY